MPEQPSARPQPKIHTTATLKSVLQTTTQVLSTLPPPTSPLHSLDHHKTLKRHIQALLHLIHASLTAAKAALTRSLTFTQQRVKHLSESLSSVTSELSQQSASRAHAFSRSAHLLSRLVSPPPPRALAPTFGPSLSLLPFARPAAAARVPPEKAHARAAFGACARELRACDDAVRARRGAQRKLEWEMRVERAAVAGRLGEVRAVVRETGEWCVVQLAVDVVDDGFEDFRNTRGRGVWDVVCARWKRVGDAVRGAVACDGRGVEGADAVVKEIAAVLTELRRES